MQLTPALTSIVAGSTRLIRPAADLVSGNGTGAVVVARVLPGNGEFPPQHPFFWSLVLVDLVTLGIGVARAGHGLGRRREQ